MGVAANEQETTINFQRVGNKATVWTSDTTVMNKLDKLCEKSDDYVLLETGVAKLGGELISKTYEVNDKTLISFRSRKIKRERTPMSDEQRQIMIERLAKARRARAEKNALQNQ